MIADYVYYFRKTLFACSLLFYLLFTVWRIVHIPLFDDRGARNSIHGDAYSDKNTYSAAMYFKDFGFSKSCFLPMFDYAGNDYTSQTAVAYTHYPALPDILAGFYAKLFSTRSEKVLRIVPVCISILFFVFIFFSVERIVPGRRAAFISSLVIVLSDYFLYWGDNLHKHLYEEFFKWIYVFGLWGYYSNEKKNKKLLILLALLYIVITNVSFEPVVFIAIVTVGVGWIFTRRIFIAENFILLLMPVMGFGIHLYQNYCWFGSWQKVVDDFKEAATLRTQGGDNARNELHRSIRLTDYLLLPLTFLNRIERFFLFPGFGFLFFAYLAIKKWGAENPRLKQFAIVLIIATVSWSLFMTQHYIVHAFTGRHVGILYALIIGTGLIEYEKLFRKHWMEKKKVFIALHIIFIGYNLFMLISQQALDIFRYGFLT